MTNYGHIFKDLREQKGMTLGEVAIQSGVAKSTLSRFENGETQLSIDKFVAALAAMELTLANFEKEEVDVAASGDILLKLKPSKPQTDLSKALDQLEVLYTKQDMSGVFSYQLNLDDKEPILAVLAKKYLIDLGLKMDLPSEDLTLVDKYFSDLKEWSVENLKLYIAFKDIVSKKLQKVSLTHLSAEDKLDLIASLIGKLEPSPYHELLIELTKKD